MEQASTPRAATWPRRDSDGRIPTFRHLLEAVGVLLVVGVVAVAVIDGLSAWAGFGGFGGTSGWLGGLMAFWLYVEEFRAWRGTRNRLLLAAVAGMSALVAGVAASWLVSGLPALFNGAIGVGAAALVYAPIWFFGIRQLVDREVT